MATIGSEEAQEIIRRAEEVNFPFWEREFEKDRRMLVAISTEIMLFGFSDRERELYKQELNLIGRDLMYVGACGMVFMKKEDRQFVPGNEFARVYCSTRNLLNDIRRRLYSE